MALAEIWTLEAGGVEKTLAGWGVSAATVARRSQAADVLDLTFGGARFDDALVFAFEQTVTLRRAGVKWFVGVVTETPRMARPNAEGVRYRAHGPWYWLDNTPYEQAWAQYSLGADEPSNADQSRVILGADQAGNPVTTGAQIAEILGYAIAAGAPFQVGTVDPALHIPTDEATDPSCAEAVLRMLRWHPDVVSWFDYTTSPTPTLHLRARANLVALTLPCAGAPAHTLDIQERPDLVPSVVALKYALTDDIDGEQRRRLVVDKYPNVTLNRPRALVLTINLQGDQAVFLKQFIRAQTISHGSESWWREKLPWLADARVKNFALDNGGAGPIGLVAAEEGETPFSKELTEGSVANWMPVETVRASAKAQVNYDIEVERDGKLVVEQHRAEVLNYDLVTTDGNTGWYSALGAFTPGEAAPVGVAQAYFQACAALQWQGAFDFLREEVEVAALGRVLNLTGGLPAWATMNALIFAATEDLATGRVSVQFGPVSYLAPADRLALARVNRRRLAANRYERAEALVTGGAAAAGHVFPRMGGGALGAGPPPHVVTVVPAVLDGETVVTPAKTVTVEIAQVDLAGLPASLTAKFRELSVCVDGAEKKLLALCTEPYDPPEEP